MVNFKANPALLFTPGNKPERFNKAIEAGANGIIYDLEDGVAAKDKNQARDNIIKYLSEQNHDTIIRIIRINHLSTQVGLTDLLTLTQIKIYFDALLYPKTESAQEINLLSKILENRYGHLPIIALLETGKGLNEIDEIVKQSQHLAGLMFGAADYAVDVNCAIDFNALMFARARIIQAASLKKLATYDSPYFDFHDDTGLKNEIVGIKTLGFTGKASIHPQQINLIKKSFKPCEQEYQDAQAIITTYEAARGEACQYKGKMIDVPVYEKAKQIIEIYKNLTR